VERINESLISRYNDSTAAFRDVTGKSIREERLPCTATFFHETSSKRRKGFPSETNVKRGFRTVRGDKELVEKLGRKDPCPCGSGRSF
jgi:uncharacterized protein YecA (UPF0149 family)